MARFSLRESTEYPNRALTPYEIHMDNKYGVYGKYAMVLKSGSTPTPEEATYGWTLDATNTGLAGVGLIEDDLTELDLAGVDSDKGNPNYGGVTGYWRINANVTISNKIISCPYYFDASAGGITIENCLIRPTGRASGMPLVNISNGIIRDCSMDGETYIPGQGVGISGTNSQILRCNLWGMSTGAQMYNSSGISLMEQCYIHDLIYVSPAHVDGITIRQATGASCKIINCRVITDVICTSAIFIQPSTGAITGIVSMEGNLMEGCTYNFAMTNSTYTLDTSNMSMINNLFNPYANEEEGAPSYGAIGNSSGKSLAVWTNNYYYDSLNPPSYRGAILNQ